MPTKEFLSDQFSSEATVIDNTLEQIFKILSSTFQDIKLEFKDWAYKGDRPDLYSPISNKIKENLSILLDRRRTLGTELLSLEVLEPSGYKEYQYKKIERGYVVLVNLRPEDRFNDCKAEHRYLMEKHIGRKLEKAEIVHHIDGDKLNNDISNLKIMNRSSHQKLHTRKK